MPKRLDLNKILIIGSGPIIIGQACEFDYSGTQACKALRNLGYSVVLVNSNPATIMTDPGMADATYIEPLNVDYLERIINKERPDAVLPNLGGQSGLNLCLELDKKGILEKYGVEVIGVKLDAIERGEDRIEFKKTMEKLGIDMPKSLPAYTVEQALAMAKEIGYPCVVRPAFTMGGTGGGIVSNEQEMQTIAARGIQCSLVGQILIEESVIGWEELEVEVVRDAKDQMISICFIENIDPMGVHTGDSFCSAPMLTVPQQVQDRLKEQAFKIVSEIQVIGGTNVQFAHDPKTDRITVIEINPRTSRSSALASKATGFPIAMVSAMLAVGLTLDEIPYKGTATLEQYTPDADYVVIKFARWAFDKFNGAQDKLGTQMKAVGEVMSIGKTYKEAFQKAIRSLEIGRAGLGYASGFHEKTKQELMELLNTPTSERQFIMYEALKKGATVEELHEKTQIKEYFIRQMSELVQSEQEILACKGKTMPEPLLNKAKQEGFSDAYMAFLLGIPEEDLRKTRQQMGITPKWCSISVCGVTKPSSYYYSTYANCENQALPEGGKNKVLILGGGPNRIGQGIEFDYCCIHAAFALKEMGYHTVMINCNPETVSTDYDTSDRLYFEPLTVEDVLSIYGNENPIGVIAQFGGQTPLNIAVQLEKAGVNVLGTSTSSISMAEDRDLFDAMMHKLEIPMPESGMATTVDEALEVAKKIGYPIIVRPSFVLGGRGMEIVHDDEDLSKYMLAAVGVTPDKPILIDRFLSHAMECEADAISDGEKVFVPAVMEHIELAGIHSGDSACIIPSKNISEENIKTIENYTVKIAHSLGVKGLMNIQYAICDGKVYVLEANPRASRTVPIISKVCNIQMAKLATEIVMLPFTGAPSPLDSIKRSKVNHYGVKEAVLPFNMFPEVDPVLGPEMRSTGEVLGISSSPWLAFFKSQEAALTPLPTSGTVLLSVNDKDKEEALEAAKLALEVGMNLMATQGTAEFLKSHGIETTRVNKLGEGDGNIQDLLAEGKIQIVINTPMGKSCAQDDSYIRKMCVKHKIPYLTTLTAAKAAMLGIKEFRQSGNDGKNQIHSLQEYHS